MTLGTSRPSEWQRALRRYLVLVAAVLTLALAVPGVASAYTRGFDVTNASSATLTLRSVSGFQYGIGSPPTGSPVLTGNRQHFEVTFEFLDSNTGTLKYDLYVGNTYQGEFLTTLTVVGIDGNTLSSCSVKFAPGYQCTANGPNITLLDPPATVHNIPAAQRQAQANVLNQLCVDQSIATCNFSAKSEVSVESPQHPVGGYLKNNSDRDQETKITIEDTVGESNSVDVAVSVGATLFKVVEASIEASYSHEWTQEHKFSQDVQVTVPPHEQCEVLGTAPMLRDTGDFSLTLGNTTWQLPDVYFDTPDVNQAGRYGYEVDCQKLTSSQRAALPPKLTVEPVVRGFYKVPQGAAQRSIARPRLRLRISGPAAVSVGELGEFQILLGRTQAASQVVYLLRAVRVRVDVAGRILRRWVVTSLPVGRSRALKFAVKVPSSASATVCLTAAATGNHAVGARAKDCVEIVESPTGGLG